MAPGGATGSIKPVHMRCAPALLAAPLRAAAAHRGCQAAGHDTILPVWWLMAAANSGTPGVRRETDLRTLAVERLPTLGYLWLDVDLVGKVLPLTGM